LVVDYSERGRIIRLREEWEPEVVVYTTIDVFGNKFYLTERHLNHIYERRRDSKTEFALAYVAEIPEILTNPDKVIIDPRHLDGNTRIYYKHYAGLVDIEGNEVWLAAPVQMGYYNFIWTLHPSPKGKVKTLPGRETVVIYFLFQLFLLIKLFFLKEKFGYTK
jgi:hypothetical protein